MKKYYIVTLRFYDYSNEKITVKARNKEKAILKALRKTNYKKEGLRKVESVEEIDIFGCLKG